MFLQAAESKNLTAALLLDQSAAHDLLDQTILLQKLAAYDFNENTICCLDHICQKDHKLFRWNKKRVH